MSLAEAFGASDPECDRIRLFSYDRFLFAVDCKGRRIEGRAHADQRQPNLGSNGRHPDACGIDPAPGLAE